MSDELPALPWERSRRRTPRVRIPLTRDRIVDAAYAVLDREGYDRLSMRQVAAELGVAVSALYAHVSSKDELFELMYIRMFRGWTLPDADPARWREQIMDFARSSRARLREHRDLARISMRSVPFNPEVLPQVDRLLGVFRAAGLPDRVAGAAGDVISTFIDGFAYEENMWEDRRREAEEGTWTELQTIMNQYFKDLPADRFPNLVALSDFLMDKSNDDRFELGMEIIVRGLASIAEEARQAGGSGPSGGPEPADGRGDAGHGERAALEELR
ncbi:MULTISPECIES: TetR/AcrR family transcriptional regulator [Streptosporangium]|uniref:AcrR family transcriptional regulator n=1 Tax=Streptosporangium brasiliense TaxID=47480 RepID=A0ABT9R8G7_9ACTN|nr:TetR/AcrR family transcriptional regulator [Streptosporangium brasiliense]MDP9865533.1 AcrR family transcriptional regulator [Streptosporangium brasiliense]